ncbi:hypothetical protein ANME2D_01892 [Candidatus Methanoperedens nitroreducens]|uniref:Uncharacterized protein n=1 Tax=Candidatus Methanoperedens nitratireducens TaxID=1392998 RepID=A0A062V3B4_9EURY|nr:hypothetical protein [Candidatus Methanoperedens nitroreducens]KCZ71837.1 hypothetical protein ANME2D_01892 [Candidatus Methanoperedens nitroreducens]MDJ1422188.1 hypothetical protein [Candidatus Methanoperedens sp.]
MEFKEINVPEGIVQQIDHEESLADITFDVGNGDNIYSNANPDVLYEDTLEDIEKTLGSVPVFMKFLPKKVLIHNWSSWKRVDEINMERVRYLLNTDEILEEMLSGT